MKKLLIILLTIFLCLPLCLVVHAETMETDLDYLYESQDIVIMVTWDVSEPSIVFISPDGIEYNPFSQYVNTNTILNEKSLYFTVKNAKSGLWRARYDKGSNNVLNVSMHTYSTPLFIDYFNIGTVSGNFIDVSFNVSADEEKYYRYKISAMTDHAGAEKELFQSSGYTGSETSISVNLSSLSSHSAYRLKLHVWYTENQADIYDFAFSENTFSYTNTDIDSYNTDYKLKVFPESGIINLSIPDITWRADSFLVAIFENGSAEPTTFDEHSTDSAETLQLTYNPQATKVDVEVSLKVNGVNTSPIRKTFEPKNFGISLPAGDATNSVSFPMTYKGMSSQLVNVKVNGYNTELVLNGDGELKINLGDNWNSIDISYEGTDNITWALSHELYVDRTPPILNMNQNYDNITLESDKLLVGGNVLDFNQVTINGSEVSVDDNGLFSMEINLNEGANIIEIIASDALGNEAKYTATVYRGTTPIDQDQSQTSQTEEEDEPLGDLYEKLTGGFFPLIIASIVGVLAILYALIFWRKEKKE